MERTASVGFQGRFRTAVYTKETNTGDSSNFKSACPERYKAGLIKSFLHRGYHVSSDWEIFHLKIERIQQIVTNNFFQLN